MGSVAVDQITRDGSLVQDVDTKLSLKRKDELLLAALPGATVEQYQGENVVRYHGQVILKKQITHLGIPWEVFKKRIQIPYKWLSVERVARRDGLEPRFVGIYHYGDVTIFVDFDPTTYVKRKANNSAAHVSTNDLFQAQTLGQFRRLDRNGNMLTSVRSDQFATYLQGGAVANPRLDVFDRFNVEFLNGDRIKSLDAIQQMHDASWRDAYQVEWPGFYLEYRMDEFIRNRGLSHLAQFQKNKKSGAYDYDLIFPDGAVAAFYGDLKASNLTAKESPGNDLSNLRKCVDEFGRFWYVVYEHETKHARNNKNRATIVWNEWRQAVGYFARARKTYDPLSYAGKFKESVKFTKMLVLEVNPANFDIVLKTFAQGKQPDGAARALKAMINKKVIENYLVYWAVAPGEDEAGGLGDVEQLIEE